MKVKVCGLKYIDNLNLLDPLSVDYIGLNFYQLSKRCIDHQNAFSFSNYKNHRKVGVFVNASFQYVKDMATIYKLDVIQLHGNESPDYVYRISEFCNVIKAFSIKTKEDLKPLVYYENCKYFLFDTKSPDYGGSGKKFDWSILDDYTLNIPFFIAGGIGPEDYIDISKINNQQLAGIDINSKFEISPGKKDIELIKSFLTNLEGILK